MQKNYRRLRLEDRGVIYRMNQEGMSQKQIAVCIGFSQSTVSKELSRNRGLRGYRIKQAHELSEKRKSGKRVRSARLVGELLLEVERLLGLLYSPEQISGWLRVQGGGQVSHETIYRHIREDSKVGGTLYKHLRINGTRRYRRRAKAGRYNKIPGRIGIENRPASVENRTRYGDWEVDLIEGSKGTGFILSMYERKTMICRLRRLDTKSAEATTKAIIAGLQRLRVRTLTYDNGPEFSRHQDVSEALSAKGYFCNAYHSWEKGGVENLNGLVRQYYSKGSSFEEITPEGLQTVEDSLNTRPKKTLDFTSPSQHEHKIAA